MLFSTVIEILASVFIVYGLYFTIKMIIFYILFPKEIRDSVCITVINKETDDEETKNIKLLCANQIAREYNLSGRVKFERK